MNLPDQIIWHDTKERSKTRWLRRGFLDLHIPVIETNRLVKMFNPRSNRLGLYVYPIGLQFGSKLVIAMLDINTIPRMVFSDLRAKTNFYFKVHATKEVLTDPKIFLFPNSASDLDFHIFLNDYRKIKDRCEYGLDFFFIGWHDDDGLRLWTVKKARSQKNWRVYAGCLPFKHHTTVEPKFQVPRMKYDKYLRTHAMSKLNLALPGGRALPFMSFRHVELMGIGCAIMTRRPTSVPFQKRVFDNCVIYYDKENFVDVANQYLENGEERERIAMLARRYYDNYLTPKAHALYMIETISRRLNLNE